MHVRACSDSSSVDVCTCVRVYLPVCLSPLVRNAPGSMSSMVAMHWHQGISVGAQLPAPSWLLCSLAPESSSDACPF